MSYRDFVFPGVERALGLTLGNTSLFPNVVPVVPHPEMIRRLEHGIRVGQGIGTEKARSEFIIAPVILEVLALLQDRYSVFSGIEFNVDAARGLTGYCDFLIARSPLMYALRAPVVAVAEAKKDDVLTGLGQCVAAMRAAWQFNQTEGVLVEQVYGVSTTGLDWKFLRLRDTDLTIDLDTYSITNPGRVMGALIHMATTA